MYRFHMASLAPSAARPVGEWSGEKCEGSSKRELKSFGGSKEPENGVLQAWVNVTKPRTRPVSVVTLLPNILKQAASKTHLVRIVPAYELNRGGRERKANRLNSLSLPTLLLASIILLISGLWHTALIPSHTLFCHSTSLLCLSVSLSVRPRIKFFTASA